MIDKDRARVLLQAARDTEWIQVAKKRAIDLRQEAMDAAASADHVKLARCVNATSCAMMDAARLFGFLADVYLLFAKAAALPSDAALMRDAVAYARSLTWPGRWDACSPDGDGHDGPEGLVVMREDEP